MWRDEFFAIAASSKPPAANSRRHRHGTDCAAIPHPSTKLPPRKTARSDALTIEMGAPEARPPTAPESWLRVGSAPPLGIEAATTSHPTSQAGSEGDSTPDTARAQPPYPSDRTEGPLGAGHTQSRIGRLTGRQHRQEEREEREREREERGEGEGVNTREEWGRVSVVGCSTHTHTHTHTCQPEPAASAVPSLVVDVDSPLMPAAVASPALSAADEQAAAALLEQCLENERAGNARQSPDSRRSS